LLRTKFFDQNDSEELIIFVLTLFKEILKITNREMKEIEKTEFAEVL